jgi:hypothetical protein
MINLFIELFFLLQPLFRFFQLILTQFLLFKYKAENSPALHPGMGNKEIIVTRASSAKFWQPAARNLVLFLPCLADNISDKHLFTLDVTEDIIRKLPGQRYLQGGILAGHLRVGA